MIEFPTHENYLHMKLLQSEVLVSLKLLSHKLAWDSSQSLPEENNLV